MKRMIGRMIGIVCVCSMMLFSSESMIFAKQPDEQPVEIQRNEARLPVVNKPIEFDSLIIKFNRKDSLRQKSSQKLLSSYKAEAIDEAHQVYEIKTKHHESAVEAMDKLRASGLVEYVEPNYPRSIEADNKGQGKPSWGVKRIGASTLGKKIKPVKENTIVAVIDTGVYREHPLLQERVVNGYDFVANDDDPNDENGHGTHVSGIIAETVGNVPIAIMPIRVLDENGFGNDSAIIQGIYYAVEHGAGVINMSLGGAGKSKALEEAVGYAISKGTVVIASAGNDNAEAEGYAPAGISELITVAATNSADEKAPFSNYGDVIDVAAPGVDIVSSVPDFADQEDGVADGYASMSGTSMAAPFAAGVAALLKADKNRYSLETIETLLKSHVDDVWTEGFDNQFGFGIMNFKKFDAKLPRLVIESPYLYKKKQDIRFLYHGGTAESVLVKLDGNEIMTAPIQQGRNTIDVNLEDIEPGEKTIEFQIFNKTQKPVLRQKTKIKLYKEKLLYIDAVDLKGKTPTTITTELYGLDEGGLHYLKNRNDKGIIDTSRYDYSRYFVVTFISDQPFFTSGASTRGINQLKAAKADSYFAYFFREVKGEGNYRFKLKELKKVTPLKPRFEAKTNGFLFTFLPRFDPLKDATFLWAIPSWADFVGAFYLEKGEYDFALAMNQGEGDNYFLHKLAIPIQKATKLDFEQTDIYELTIDADEVRFGDDPPQALSFYPYIANRQVRAPIPVPQPFDLARSNRVKLSEGVYQVELNDSGISSPLLKRTVTLTKDETVTFGGELTGRVVPVKSILTTNGEHLWGDIVITDQYGNRICGYPFKETYKIRILDSDKKLVYEPVTTGSTTHVVMDLYPIEIKPGNYYLEVVDYKHEILGSSSMELTPITVVNDDFTIPFSDRRFEASIKEAVGKNEQLSYWDVQPISFLDVANKGIKSLVGIEYVSSLDQVLAADNQLTDLTPLKNLQNLKILDLSRNQIHDLSPLLNLINLEKLIIQSNPLNEESQAVIEELRKNGVRVLDDKAGRVLQEITVNSDRVTVRAGEDVQLELTANYKDGSTEDVTALAQWSSFDPGIVSVEKGRIHGHRAGETLILVSYKGKQTMLIAIVE